MGSKIQIDIYKGLPMVLERVKSVALSAVMGKSNAWIFRKLNHNVSYGKPLEFCEVDIPMINNGIKVLGDEISECIIEYLDDREDVIRQVKELSVYVNMSYVCEVVLNKPKRWYSTRMLARVPGRKVCVFKEDDILAINMAAMQIANELRSIEFVLK